MRRVLFLLTFGLATAALGCGSGSNVTGDKVDPAVVKQADDRVNEEETSANNRRKAKK